MEIHNRDCAVFNLGLCYKAPADSITIIPKLSLILEPNFLQFVSIKRKLDFGLKFTCSRWIMDVSSRKVHGQVQHEVIFGARIEQRNNKLIPLARAYMTSQTALVYKTLFEKLLHFKRLNSISHVSVRWQHIHQEGVVGVTLPQNAEAVQDAQCLEAGDSDRSAGSMRQKMTSLPDAETSAAYTELCGRLEA
ncbi:hypothetical protein E4U09_008130, partial [Claviceps aff. purpurea]